MIKYMIAKLVKKDPITQSDKTMFFGFFTGFFTCLVLIFIFNALLSRVYWDQNTAITIFATLLLVVGYAGFIRCKRKVVSTN